MSDENELLLEESAEEWIMEKCDGWREHFESNYEERFDEYNRLWRGIWAGDDSLRKSERSRIISPALQQAVESSVAEVEEATFGRGQFFDIRDDMDDKERGDVEYLKNALSEEFSLNKTRQAISECIVNSAVFGTGIGEVVVQEKTRRVPMTQPAMDGQVATYGVMETKEVSCTVRPVLPQNFLIDPVASSIEEALGCAIDEYVPIHQVQQLIEEGVYEDVDIDPSSSYSFLEANDDVDDYDEDRIRLTKYYGLLPRSMLESYLYSEDEEVISLSETLTENGSNYVEVIAVIANGTSILKMEENPYMMQDRPVVAFPWDVVPSRFGGVVFVRKDIIVRKLWTQNYVLELMH